MDTYQAAFFVSTTESSGLRLPTFRNHGMLYVQLESSQLSHSPRRFAGELYSAILPPRLFLIPSHSNSDYPFRDRPTAQYQLIQELLSPVDRPVSLLLSSSLLEVRICTSSTRRLVRTSGNRVFFDPRTI